MVKVKANVKGRLLSIREFNAGLPLDVVSRYGCMGFHLGHQVLAICMLSRELRAQATRLFKG